MRINRSTETTHVASTDAVHETLSQESYDGHACEAEVAGSSAAPVTAPIGKDSRQPGRCPYGSTCPPLCPDCNASGNTGADNTDDYESRAIAQKIRSNATALLNTEARIVTRLHDGANLLDKDIVGVVAEETSNELKKHVQERHAERASKWTKHMCHGWKKKAAQAFFRFLRNDNKTPLRSFPDPDNGGKLTSDTRRVEELFCNTWKPIFNRPDNELPPDWEHFKAKYKEPLTPLDPVRADDFQAKELAAQAAKFKNQTVGGIDCMVAC
jgi:hypothetical protein